MEQEHLNNKKELRALITNMDSNYDNLNLESNNKNNKKKYFFKKNSNMSTKQTQNENSNIFNTLTNLHLNTTIKRRFSENYYKSLEHHKRPRLVKKCGELNIHMDNVPKHKRRLLSDFFNTVLDIKWRWHIIIFTLTFLISWFLFATVWYSIAYLHGDLNQTQSKNHFTEKDFNSSSKADQNFFQKLNELEKNIYILNNTKELIDKVLNNIQNNNRKKELDISNMTYYEYRMANLETEEETTKQNHLEHHKHMPCVHGIHDFTSALLYSVETQHTIGYGLRYITEECTYAIIFLMIQSCFGIFIQGLVAGVVFAKISRPSKRKRTIIFSHNAVVSKRDGKLCFMFKIGNIRISQLSDAKLRLSMIKSRRTNEGEFIPFQSYDMKVGIGNMETDSVFFPWPKTVEHVIDENSPFYDMCKYILNNDNNTSLSSSSSSTSSSSDTLTQPTFPLRDHESSKHDDYEIVVILEGNIETTGASCHIRTSYLPQEILFGYRFVPIYPKFTDFEYLFDYSKFDQVEPISLDLMYLNKAHINRDLNYVYDARNEDKNYQLTFQNTIQNQNQSKINHNEPVSIKNILKAFRTHNSKENLKNHDSLSNNKNQFKNENCFHFNDDYQTLSSNDKYINTLTTMMSESKTDVNRESTHAMSKNGRFTVVPVTEFNQSRKTSNSPSGFKHFKHILNNCNHNKKFLNQNKTHQRTSSLPPINSSSILEQFEANDEDKVIIVKPNNVLNNSNSKFFIN